MAYKWKNGTEPLRKIFSIDNGVLKLRFTHTYYGWNSTDGKVYHAPNAFISGSPSDSIRLQINHSHLSWIMLCFLIFTARQINSTDQGACAHF